MQYISLTSASCHHCCMCLAHLSKLKVNMFHVDNNTVCLRLCAGEGKADSACQVEMLRALNAALTSVPTAFRSHQKALETLACTLLASPNLGAEQRREAAYCYAILPRVKGKSAAEHLARHCHCRALDNSRQRCAFTWPEIVAVGTWVHSRQHCLQSQRVSLIEHHLQ